MLVRQRRRNKFSTPFEPIPYILEGANGTMITAKRTTDPLKTNNEKQLPIYKKVKTTDYVHTEPTDDQVPWNFEADVGNESISETENNTYLPETEQIVEEESGQSSPNQCGQKTTLY